ncbi:prolyl oligopeptidase family serine peptidase [Thalassotalea nanhaiensis]|uniref:Prolyl oligopeptidase family serine peptidase n=1 Tax=Thalassotalea nanhaiensis TaxID=3065648 RepID=A0ABY9THD5_9GAMM|nr:prolyl oligopeptidase family serine peptidase [Colwelliaceae bacterium SQ345]
MLNSKAFSLVVFFLVVMPLQAAASIDTKLFFQHPDMLQAQISPNGENIAALRFINDTQNIVLIDSDTKQQTLWLNLAEFSKFEAKISNIAWIDDNHLAAQFIEIKKGVAGLLDTKSVQRLLILQRPDNEQVNVFSVKTKGSLIHPLPERANEFLYAKSGLSSKVYTLKIDKLALHGKKLSKLHKVDGGQFKKSNEVVSLKGFATRWFLDQSGEIKAAFNLSREGEWNLTQFSNDNETKVIHTWQFKEEDDAKDAAKLLPIAYAGEENSYYCLDFNAEQQRVVYKVNFETGKESVVYQADSYKIVDVTLTKDDALAAIKVLNEGKIDTVYIANNNAKEKFDFGKTLSLIAEISTSVDNSSSIYYGESHDHPGEFYLVQAPHNNVVHIGAVNPDLNNQLSSNLLESTVEVEGLQIPYLLTMPTTERKNYPLIIMPHGGPIDVYDNRYYNPVTQLLVANGYAVLQVNFRGSSGYTTELRDAGKKQFGGLMLTDIYQAAEQVMAKPNIDENNVCTFGISYGGYAAMMLPLNHPGKFKCAVNFAGVSDINLLLNQTSLSSKQAEWMKENIGDSMTEHEQLKAISPVYLAKKFQVPTFIGHGAKDEIVDIEHAYRMKLMLEKYNKPFEWLIDPEGTHSFGSPEQTVKFFDALLVFLNKHVNN